MLIIRLSDKNKTFLAVDNILTFNLSEDFHPKKTTIPAIIINFSIVLAYDNKDMRDSDLAQITMLMGKGL